MFPSEKRVNKLDSFMVTMPLHSRPPNHIVRLSVVRLSFADSVTSAFSCHLQVSSDRRFTMMLPSPNIPWVSVMTFPRTIHHFCISYFILRVSFAGTLNRPRLLAPHDGCQRCVLVAPFQLSGSQDHWSFSSQGLGLCLETTWLNSPGFQIYKWSFCRYWELESKVWVLWSFGSSAILSFTSSLP